MPPVLYSCVVCRRDFQREVLPPDPPRAPAYETCPTCGVNLFHFKPLTGAQREAAVSPPKITRKAVFVVVAVLLFLIVVGVAWWLWPNSSPNPSSEGVTLTPSPPKSPNAGKSKKHRTPQQNPKGGIHH
jgi:hypothetical protein